MTFSPWPTRRRQVDLDQAWMLTFTAGRPDQRRHRVLGPEPAVSPARRQNGWTRSRSRRGEGAMTTVALPVRRRHLASRRTAPRRRSARSSPPTGRTMSSAWLTCARRGAGFPLTCRSRCGAVSGCCTAKAGVRHRRQGDLDHLDRRLPRPDQRRDQPARRSRRQTSRRRPASGGTQARDFGIIRVHRRPLRAAAPVPVPRDRRRADRRHRRLLGQTWPGRSNWAAWRSISPSRRRPWPWMAREKVVRHRTGLGLGTVLRRLRRGVPGVDVRTGKGSPARAWAGWDEAVQGHVSGVRGDTSERRRPGRTRSRRCCRNPGSSTSWDEGWKSVAKEHFGAVCPRRGSGRLRGAPHGPVRPVAGLAQHGDLRRAGRDPAHPDQPVLPACAGRQGSAVRLGRTRPYHTNQWGRPSRPGPPSTA